MQGYIESVDWDSKTPESITEDDNYKLTCESFIQSLTVNIKDKYKSNISSFDVLSFDLIENYNYFNRPKEWDTHNPICNKKLDDFTMQYIRRPEYQNKTLTLEIIKAYIASAIFDDLFLHFTRETSASKIINIVSSNRSLPKYLVYRTFLLSLKWFSKWLLLPLLAIFLYYINQESLAIIITTLFSFHLFSRLTNIIDFAIHRYQELKNNENKIQAIDERVYIFRVLSQEVIHIGTLKKLIDQHSKKARGVFSSPLMILLDTFNEESYLAERES